ncbi:hypothetical protein [Maricaulis sp. CAU 1757]
MKLSFVIVTAILAVAVFAGLTALDYFNFGALELNWTRAGVIFAVWLGVLVAAGLIGQVKRATTPRPAHVPDDVAREIDAHR